MIHGNIIPVANLFHAIVYPYQPKIATGIERFWVKFDL